MPQWLDDGYADYVAREIDLTEALRKLNEDARELDPRRSGRYVRYHLMVSHLLDRKGRTVEQLLAAPPNGDTVERELLSVMH